MGRRRRPRDIFWRNAGRTGSGTWDGTGCGEKDFGRGWERNRVAKKAGEREEEAGECGNECEKEMRILERVRRKRRLGERER